MIPKMWERIIIKWRKSYIEGGSKLAGKKDQFSTGIFKTEFSDIVKNTALIGGKSAQPNKLTVFLIDGSFLDVWLSNEFDYSFHLE